MKRILILAIGIYKSFFPVRLMSLTSIVPNEIKMIAIEYMMKGKTPIRVSLSHPNDS